MRTGLRTCYTAEATETQGALRFTIKVGANGAVTSVSSQRNGELSGTLVACATGVVKNAKFDPPENGAATVQVPVMFVVQ